MVVINFVLIFIYLYLLSNIPGSEQARNFRLEDQKKKNKIKKKNKQIIIIKKNKSKQELKTARDKRKYIILICFVEVTVLFC